MVRHLLLAFAIVFSVFSGALLRANEGTVAFVGATLIDGTGAAALPDAVLVVRDGVIQAIGARREVTVPNDADIVDLAGKYLMPGLVNAHAHVGGTLGLETGHYNRENLLRQLGLYARYGVTTVNSLGGDAQEGFALRNEQATAALDRARLLVAGSVVSGQGVEAVRAEVNRNADMGANFIKTRIDDNLGRTDKYGPEEIDALVDQANKRRLPTAIHLFYLEDAKYVAEAGVDMIAHSVRDQPVDSAFLVDMLARDICYVPTLTREVSTFVYESEPEFFADPFFLKEASPAVMLELLTPERMSRMAASPAAQAYKAGLEVAMANVGMLARAGVTIATGTDSGPPARFQGYFTHMEMQMMVDAGMSPAEVIRASTGVAASCIGMDESVGTLEPHKWADFIVLGADPLADIANTKSIEAVFIAGNLVPGSDDSE